MNTQRKIIRSGIEGSISLADVRTISSFLFDSAPAVNVHGLNVTLGIAPVDPEEVMRARWFIVALPNSIVHDSTVFAAWIDNLKFITPANDALEGSEFVWGSGSVVCSDVSPAVVSFSPKSLRNLQKGSALYCFVVADTISGLLDEWEAAATMSFFTFS